MAITGDAAATRTVGTIRVKQVAYCTKTSERPTLSGLVAAVAPLYVHRLLRPWYSVFRTGICQILVTPLQRHNEAFHV